MAYGDEAYLSGARKHAFACIKLSTASFLNLFDLGPTLADNGTHTRVGDDEFNSNRATSWD